MHLVPPQVIGLALLLAGCFPPAGETGETAPPLDSDPPEVSPSHVVLAWPRWGMNAMDPSYATASLRPPGVTLRAQVLERGGAPVVVSADLTLRYAPVDSAQVSGATDFWDHAPALLGELAPPQGQGLSGLGLEGQASVVDGIFEASLVPVVPTSGSGDSAPFPLVRLGLLDSDGVELRSGLVVAPSSWDLGCGLCHGEAWQADVLAHHDENHESTLAQETPVRCGACHAQAELGWAGDGEAAALATAMHGAHAERMAELDGQIEVPCQACHPGPDTPFYRGNHSLREVGCTDCHGEMNALVAEGRTPWQDLPRCADCHATPGVDYEQAGVSYGDSLGHGGLRCQVCHHAAHGLYSSTLEADNAQNLELQGYAGVVSTCKVCHDPNPGGLFPHVVDP